MSSLLVQLAHDLHARLTLLFLFLIVGLTLLVSGYWFSVLEPRLLADAQASAGALAQSQSKMLAAALSSAITERKPDRLRDAMDEVLVLTDSATRLPFVIQLEVRVDYDVVNLPPDQLDLRRGAPCPTCFVNKLPLYSHDGTELLGIATFHSSNAFFEQLRSQVRRHLAVVSVAAIALLLLSWRVVDTLFQKVRASEEAASRAMRAKSDFLATMSHEIRTPMNGVMGMTTLLRDTPLDDRQRRYLDAIDSSADALLVLIDDILDISKIEAGKLTLEQAPCDLRRILADIHMLLSSKAEAKGLQLRIEFAADVPRLVAGDAVRLRQVFTNLIGNAIKFTDHGSVTTEVRVSAPDESGAMRLHCAVVDTGIGIPPEKQSLLFQKFMQADTTITRKFGGTGLGLAISARLVQAMDGVIDVESRPGEGSRFFFEIPTRALAAETKCEAREEPPAPGRSLRVLLTEDSEINRHVARALLQRAGHYVIEARDGSEALELLAREPVDVVLMDLQMPVMDGLEATRRLRASGLSYADVPVIALTANALKEERDAALQAGMNGFIIKPFKPAQLDYELSRLCRGQADAAAT